MDVTASLNIPQVPLEEIYNARDRLQGTIRKTPLYELDVHDLVEDDRRIFVKLENLQETGSFKLRGAANALSSLISREGNKIKAGGIYTCSAGNFAQGMAYSCRSMGVKCTIIVPNTAPRLKIAAIKRYGAEVVEVPYDTWWNVMTTGHYDGVNGSFIHPVCNRDVIAGNGTIGLEIVECLDNKIDAVISPFGGGGLSTGIGSAMRSLQPSAALYACEVETAAPLAISLKAGRPSIVENHKTSFVDGMGGKSIFPQMWPLATSLIEDSLVLSLDRVAEAVRLLMARRHVVPEGAGAAPVAAALDWHQNENINFKDKTVVCIVSGGNIDADILSTILTSKL